jgi:EmrB/QacA subfamily drug resistance transporter
VSTPARLGLLLTVMCTALALVLGAGTSLAVALPAIATDTGATQTELSYVVNVYALVFAALLLPAGIAADRFGRRPALVLGLVVFGAASLASAFAPDPTTLIVLRAVAGVGATAVMPATLSVLVDAFPPERRAFAVSVWAGVSGAGSLVGLLLTGLLLEVFWWGSVQVVFGVVALALVAAVAVLVPTSRRPGLALDPVGSALAASGLAALVLGIIEGPERGWADAVTLTALAGGAVLLALFVVHERRTPAPLLDVRLFGRGLSTGSSLVFLQFFAASGFFLLAPQFLQSVLGRSTLEAVLSLLPLTAGIAPGSALAPRLVARSGPRVVGAAGMGAMAAGFVLLAVVGAGPYWQFGPSLALFGLGFGLAVTPGTTFIIDGLPADRRTLASAVNDVTREVGAALGGSLLASVLVTTYADAITPAARDLPPGAADAAGDGVAAALGVADSLGPAGAALAEAAREAFTDGYRTALVLGAAALVLGAALCAVLAPRSPQQFRPDPTPDPARDPLETP